VATNRIGGACADCMRKDEEITHLKDLVVQKVQKISLVRQEQEFAKKIHDEEVANMIQNFQKSLLDNSCAKKSPKQSVAIFEKVSA
jgi:hypothetical protein